MSKQSGFLKKQNAKTEDISIKIQSTTRQFMIDTLQIALHETEGWGYDRLVRLSLAWAEIRREYHSAIDPNDKMCDVQQERMQRAFKDICARRNIDPIRFEDRYPYLKDVRYDRKYK